jgi:hypothetical protein
LQIRAFQHVRLDEDGEGDEAQLLELSGGDDFAPGGGATVRLRRRWSSASFLPRNLADTTSGRWGEEWWRRERVEMD